MRNILGVLVTCVCLAVACTSPETNVKGVIIDRTEEQLTIRTAEGDTLCFKVDGERATADVLLLWDTASVCYRGAYSAGMAVEGTTIIPCTELGDTQGLGRLELRIYRGLLADTSGRVFRGELAVRSREHSGDGVFTLVMDRQEQGGGIGEKTVYAGRRFTQRGMYGDNDATVWQLVADGPQKVLNFLRQDETALRLLDDSFRVNRSRSESTLKLVE